MKAKRGPSLSRSFMLTSAITVSLIAILGLVVISPLALERLTYFERNWAQLSSIGQTYGAVSALLSSLALGGVAISLLYQARDSRTTHEEASRTFQHQLLKMELEDPSLMNAFGAPYNLAMASDITTVRQFIFIQMWVSYLAGNYAIGESSESGIRHFAANELFTGAAGRSYWEASGQDHLRLSSGRRRDFFRFLDDEYKRAIACKVPIASPVVAKHSATPDRVAPKIGRHEARELGLVAIAAAIGGIAGGLWGRRSS